MRGQQPDRAAQRGAFLERRRRDLLRRDLFEQRRHACLGSSVLQPRRCVEQPDDRIEVAVGGAAGGAGRPGRSRQPARPTGAFPQRPEHLVRSCLCTHLLDGGGEQPRQSAGRVCHPVFEGQQIATVGDGIADEQRRRPRSRLAGGSVERTQPTTQGAQHRRCCTSERRQQQRASKIWRQRRPPVRRDIERTQQRRYRRVAGQRDLVGGDGHGHPGGHQRAAQHRDAAHPGPHQDGHVVPAQTVDQMRAAQRVGDGADLLGHRRIEADARRLVGRRTGRLQAPMLIALAGQVAERDLARELTRHREQLCAHTATGAETHDARRAAVAVREAGAELEDVADVGATEPVDRLVRVAHGDQQPAVACQVLQQSFLRRISVLVFVDVHRVEASAKLLCRPLQQPPGLGD